MLLEEREVVEEIEGAGDCFRFGLFKRVERDATWVAM